MAAGSIAVQLLPSGRRKPKIETPEQRARREQRQARPPATEVRQGRTSAPKPAIVPKPSELRREPTHLQRQAIAAAAEKEAGRRPAVRIASGDLHFVADKLSPHSDSEGWRADQGGLRNRVSRVRSGSARFTSFRAWPRAALGER